MLCWGLRRNRRIHAWPLLRTVNTDHHATYGNFSERFSNNTSSGEQKFAFLIGVHPGHSLPSVMICSIFTCLAVTAVTPRLILSENETEMQGTPIYIIQHTQSWLPSVSKFLHHISYEHQITDKYIMHHIINEDISIILFTLTINSKWQDNWS